MTGSRLSDYPAHIQQAATDALPLQQAKTCIVLTNGAHFEH